MKGKADGVGLLLALKPKGKGDGEESASEKDMSPKEMAADVVVGSGDKDTRRQALLDLIEMCVAEREPDEDD